MQIKLFERPGVALSAALQTEIEKHFTRQELRRASFGDVGAISYPARAREGYATDLVSELDAEAIRARGFRIVVDYGYSAASYVLPLLLGRLGVEAVTSHPFESDSAAGRHSRRRRRRRRAAWSRRSTPTWARSATGRPSACS